MRKYLASVACGVLLVLSLGQVSAFAVDSTATQNTAGSSSVTSSSTTDDSSSSTALSASTGERDTSTSAEDAGTKGKDESQPTGSDKTVSTSESTTESTQTESSDAIQDEGLVNYRAHVQNVGWQDWTKDGAIAGTTGKALRVEALQLKLRSDFSGSIEYRAHVQNVGWQAWAKDGEVAGTSGKALRVEALCIRLTGDVAKRYDIRYRVHVQNEGWTEWIYNGDIAGTVGKALRIEAVEVELVQKQEASVTGTAHVQDYGWTKTDRDGAQLGVTGKGKRLEAFNLQLAGTMNPDADGSHIEYCAHVQNVGWQSYVADGANAGTTGKSLRVEAVKIRLSGPIAQKYDVWYRVHVQNYGWLAWAKDDAVAGTTKLGLRVEAMQVVLRAKDAGAPSANGNWSLPSFSAATVSYATHVQNVGWQAWQSNGALSGTTGRSLRVEAFKATVKSDEVTGGISYSTHVEGKGWTAAVADGAVSGTVGAAKRVEALKVTLTGDMAKYYDVWYRAYVQDYGWLGWTKNGAIAGSTGISYRVEALEMQVLAKGAVAPGSTASPYVTKAKARVHFHNIHAVGQPNGFFCGPTSGYMVLSNVGAWRSKSGTALSIENVASYMHTRQYGYTSFANRMFEKGMNAWLGRSVYTTYHTPSYATVRSSVLKSYSTGYATCVDEQERRGGPHFNGHGNTTFSHIMVIDGYNEATDQVYFADPACSLYAGASPHFWYPSLRTFTNTYLANEYIRDGKQHIGIYTSR